MRIKLLKRFTIRDFLSPRAVRDGATVSAYRRPMGYQQITLAGATFLTVPTLANSGLVPGYVIIQCIGAASTDYAAWRDDGTAPTNTISMRLYSGQELDYSGDLYSIQFILGSGSPVLNISYYG